ncbi:hypothetical protein D3Z45_06170 [Lachnospiraceae bacterium]|nr:hypothetical protein [Lachnospiraceae bacterium]
MNSWPQDWNKRSFGGAVTDCKTAYISSGVLDDGKLSLKEGKIFMAIMESSFRAVLIYAVTNCAL